MNDKILMNMRARKEKMKQAENEGQTVHNACQKPLKTFLKMQK